MMVRASLSLSVVVIIGCLAARESMCGEQRKWTSADGKYSVVGEMVGFLEDSVTIEKENMSGSIQVPLARLSDADRKYAFWQRKSLGLKPNGEATVTKDGPKWILNSQIVVGLPAGTSRWVVRSNNPAVFVASTMSSALNVDCLPFIEGRQRRVLLINDALEECRLALKDLGATITEEPEKATDPPSRYNGRFAATSKDGMELECRLQVRFDLEGCIIFRAVGSKSFVDGAMAEADAMRYLKSSQPEPRESAASPGQTSLPADKEKSVKEFVQKIKKLLRENDNSLSFKLLRIQKNSNKCWQAERWTKLPRALPEAIKPNWRLCSSRSIGRLPNTTRAPMKSPCASSRKDRWCSWKRLAVGVYETRA